jgi:hypothetical protein
VSRFSAAPAGRLVRFFADSFARDFVCYFGIDPARYEYARHFSLWFARSFTWFSPFHRGDGLPFHLATGGFSRCFSSNCARGFAVELAYNVAVDFGLDPEDFDLIRSSLRFFLYLLDYSGKGGTMWCIVYPCLWKLIVLAVRGSYAIIGGHVHRHRPQPQLSARRPLA